MCSIQLSLRRLLFRGAKDPLYLAKNKQKDICPKPLQLQTFHKAPCLLLNCLLGEVTTQQFIIEAPPLNNACYFKSSINMHLKTLF